MSAFSGLEKDGCGRGCPCECHEPLFPSPHEGVKCLGKIKGWPATWEGSTFGFRVDGRLAYKPVYVTVSGRRTLLPQPLRTQNSP